MPPDLVHLDGFRSFLFVPATQERFLARAHERGADAVILDLEDSIPPAEKDAARAALAQAAVSLSARGVTVLVRVNSGDRRAADITAALAARVAGLVVPKVESREDILSVAAVVAESSTEARAGIGLLPVCETPRAVLAAPELASASPWIVGLAFGSEDFAAEMGIVPDETALTLPAQMVAIAARAAGKPAFGVPGSIALIDDHDRFERIAGAGKALGMSGAMAVHPRQVDIINRVFGPSPVELAEAARIREAYERGVEHGLGAVALDGRMIDEPIYHRARSLLERAAARAGSLPTVGDR